jgi:uncharacterized RDD family membrane protein YckC
MSAPDQPTLFAPSVPTFGGYAPEQSQLQGVTFWPRVGARVIDMLVHYLVSFVSGILFVILLVIASGGHASPVAMARLQHTGVAGFVFALLGSFAYHVVFTTVHGSTLGKIALSMVVVEEDGSPCKFKSALIRELGYFVDAMFFGIIGYAAMKDDIRQQRHGDDWAHTIVCKRSLIARDKLRGGDRFAIALVFALIADAAFAMLGLLFAVMG